MQIWNHWSTPVHQFVQIHGDAAVHDLRYLSIETNTRVTEEIPALNQNGRGYNHPTSNWPYYDHLDPSLVPGTADCLSPLWWNADHWPYASEVCYATGKSWWILHCWLMKYSLRDSSRDLHSNFLQEAGFFYLIWMIRPSLHFLTWFIPELMRLY